MRKYLRSFSIHNYLVIVFLVILVISIGLISNNVSTVRDPRPQAASVTIRPIASGVLNSHFTTVGCGLSNSHACIDEVSLNTGDYIEYPGTGAALSKAYDTAVTIPSGTTATSVKVKAVVDLTNSSGVIILGAWRLATSGGYNQCNANIPVNGSNWVTVELDVYQECGSSFSFSPENFPMRILIKMQQNQKIKISQLWVEVSYSSPPPPPPPPPDSDPPPTNGGGSTPTSPTSGGGSTFLPSSPPSIPGVGAPIDPNIVNTLKLSLSIPHLLGEISLTVKIGSFTTTLNITPGKNDYEIDVKGAKFPLGKDLTVEIGGNKVLIKKIKIKTKAPKQPVKLGILYLGDTDMDNKIDQIDIERYFEAIVNQSENGDLNGDGVVNSLDWAILLVNFGKVGSR